MAELIIGNNICWDQALLKQVWRYKQDGTVPQLLDKNFSAIASAVSLKAGKITWCIQLLKVQKPVIAMSKLDWLEVDLIDMSKWAGSNNSRRYTVSIIDCFSKYSWLLPITQKKTEKVLEVPRPFLKEHTPKVLQRDNSCKFSNAHMKELLEGPSYQTYYQPPI